MRRGGRRCAIALPTGGLDERNYAGRYGDRLRISAQRATWMPEQPRQAGQRACQRPGALVLLGAALGLDQRGAHERSAQPRGGLRRHPGAGRRPRRSAGARRRRGGRARATRATARPCATARRRCRCSRTRSGSARPAASRSAGCGSGDTSIGPPQACVSRRPRSAGNIRTRCSATVAATSGIALHPPAEAPAVGELAAAPAEAMRPSRRRAEVVHEQRGRR